MKKYRKHVVHSEPPQAWAIIRRGLVKEQTSAVCQTDELWKWEQMDLQERTDRREKQIWRESVWKELLCLNNTYETRCCHFLKNMSVELGGAKLAASIWSLCTSPSQNSLSILPLYSGAEMVFMELQGGWCCLGCFIGVPIQEIDLILIKKTHLSVSF